jgi:hypothetical protein
MSFLSSLESPGHALRHALLGAALLAATAISIAAPTKVLPFGPNTWIDLQQSGARPHAVVFSTTDCSHCPAAIDRIAASLRSSRPKPRLTVVVMDGQGQDGVMLADRHYRQADTLYAFDGDAARLRYLVNPEWRGLTPYVVLLPAARVPQFFNGVPPEAMLRRFLQP